jgi:hypothetical protein
MAQSASLQTQGLEKLLKKLDAKAMTAPAEKIVIADLAQSGASYLRTSLASRFPVTAGTVRVNLQPARATIQAQRHPYVFFERGSVYPRDAQGQKDRLHRRRANVKQGALRIKALRFLAKTRADVRKNLPGALDKAAKQIEKDWAA